MAEMKRIEVGFAGGQVMSARVSEDALQTLREAVQRGHDWHDLDAEDGPVTLDTETGGLRPHRRRRAHDRLLRQVRKLVALGLLGVVGVALWWRKNPSACPYSQRFWVAAPHPVITRERLRQVLEPTAGERVLEIGPGTGYYTLDLAEWVGHDGTVEILDLQQEMLDHTIRRARERGLWNVNPTRGDARELPYDDDSFDAAILVTVSRARSPIRTPRCARSHAC